MYQCKDDVAIASGAPGAMMFDQNIREMYVISSRKKTSVDFHSFCIDCRNGLGFTK